MEYQCLRDPGNCKTESVNVPQWAYGCVFSSHLALFEVGAQSGARATGGPPEPRPNTKTNKKKDHKEELHCKQIGGLVGHH